jgi:hypothetical protein
LCGGGNGESDGEERHRRQAKFHELKSGDAAGLARFLV